MVNGTGLFFALFNNLAIFATLVILYGFLLVRFERINTNIRQIILGVLFGIFSIAVMFAKIELFEGVFVDQRNTVIILSGIFGGPLSAAMGALLAGSARIYLGGDGAIAGVVGVCLTTAAGIALHRLSWRFDTLPQAILSALLGAFVGLLAFLFVGDIQSGWALFKAMVVPFGAAIFLGIFFGGLLLRREETRYQVEQLLRQSEEKYRNVVNGMDDMIAIVDNNANFSFLNPVGEKVFGIPVEECIGQPVFKFIHPDDYEVTSAFFHNSIAEKVPHVEIENRQINATTGKVFTLQWAASFHYDDAGNFVEMGTIGRDITDRKEAEESLLESEERYRTLFERAPYGIFIADFAGTYLHVNPSLCEMLGYTREEIIGRSGADFVMPEEVQYIGPGIEQVKVSDEYRRVWQFRHKDGTAITADVTVTEMLGHMIIGVVRDITEQQALEAQLRHVQKMESMGQLAGGIAHDFNNILVPIMGYADLALMKLSPNEGIYTNLQQIRTAAERAARLTRQILAFSRKQVMQMESLNLNAIVVDFKVMAQRIIGEDIELETFLEPELLLVNVDKGQIEQVLLNLVVNAREAMSQGGKLTIETANVYLDEEYINQYADTLTPGQYIMLAVSDTGVGIDLETQKQIFEPFFTTKEQSRGTGLGLSTVLGIIQQHGGKIWVYSEIDKGTTFKIYLPQSDEDLQTSENSPVELSLVHGVETVMVVEDEEMARELVCETLRAYGYEVLEARDTEHGVQIASDFEGVLHLLLTDVIMPHTNGRELYETISSYHPDMEVLYMSGYTDNVIVHHGILDEGVNFIQKPFTVQSLIQKVRQVLGAAKA